MNTPDKAASAESLQDWTPAGVALAIAALHFLLLACSLRDYNAVTDAGFHVSLGRWYAEHGSAWWDWINFAPVGRPNLQGPAIQVAIGALGRILGGTGDDYVLANALLSLLEWSSAVYTAYFFARLANGMWAAAFAVCLLTGTDTGSAYFHNGLPSGWMLIAVPWAIYSFLNGRIISCTLFGAFSIYAHVGGIVCVPFGLAIAAWLNGNWRQLAKSLTLIGLLTLPFSVHLVRYSKWLHISMGYESLWLDPFVDLLALAGYIQLLRNRSGSAMLWAWSAAPLPWTLHAVQRFVGQSTIAWAVVAGIFVQTVLAPLRPRVRHAAYALVIAIATLFPLNLPSLAVEMGWDLGLKFPRWIDWNETKSLARIIESSGLSERIAVDYDTSFGSALATYAPIRVEGGHWTEVRAPKDSALALPAEQKVYLVPLEGTDAALSEMCKRKLVKVWGGTATTTVITLENRPEPRAISELVAEITASEAKWLSIHAINNSVPSLLDLVHSALSNQLSSMFKARDSQLRAQRFAAGRIELALLVYSSSLEPSSRPLAESIYRSAWLFGRIAGILSESEWLNNMSDDRHHRFRENMGSLASSVICSPEVTLESIAFRHATDQLFAGYFWASTPGYDPGDRVFSYTVAADDSHALSLQSSTRDVVIPDVHRSPLDILNQY